MNKKGEANMILGMNIRFLREKNNLSIKELASTMGVTPQTIRYIESGKRGTKSNRIQELAKIFAVSVDDLLRDNRVFDKDGNAEVVKFPHRYIIDNDDDNPDDEDDYNNYDDLFEDNYTDLDDNIIVLSEPQPKKKSSNVLSLIAMCRQLNEEQAKIVKEFIKQLLNYTENVTNDPDKFKKN